MARTRVKWRTGAGVALLVALAFALWWLWPVAEAPGDGAAPAGREPGARTPRAARRPAARSKSAPSHAGKDARKDAGGPLAGTEAQKGAPPADEAVPADEAERLVEAFDDLTDTWIQPAKTDVPMEAVERFRQQFNKVPQARKEECLQRALNLVPDENAMLLAGILLDKSQPPEFLELVYNDILNRDESVKKPLLREIFKDKGHPCWANTAWILDVTGEMPRK